jgi:hypothetical protein
MEILGVSMFFKYLSVKTISRGNDQLNNGLGVFFIQTLTLFQLK